MMPQDKQILKISHLLLGTVFVVFGSLSLAILLYAIFLKMLMPLPSSMTQERRLGSQGLAETEIYSELQTNDAAASNQKIKGVKTVNWWQMILGWLNS